MGFKYLSISFLLLFAFNSCGTSGKKYPGFHWKVGGTLSDQANPDMASGLAGPVVGVSENRLIVAGGSNFPEGSPWEKGVKKYYDAAQVYKKQRDTIIPAKLNLHLPYKVGYSANTTVEKGVVVAGGENEGKVLNKVLLLNWDSTEQKLNIQHLPKLPQRLTAGAVAHLNHQLYFAGGQNKKTVSDKLYRLDLNQLEKGWDTLPNIPHKVSHALLYADTADQHPGLYLVGGRKRNKKSTSDLYRKVYRYDVEKGEWEEKASLPYPLSASTGVNWKGNQLLVFSGDRGKTFHETEKLIAKIDREKDSLKRHKLITEKNELQQSHPGFDGTVLSYNIRADQWRKVDSIPFPGQVTTTAVKWGGEVVIPGGEIRAGVRTGKIILGIPK